MIPSEMREALGIKPGTRIAVTQDGSRIVLEPISEELVDRTRGMLAGGPSLPKPCCASVVVRKIVGEEGSMVRQDRW